MPAAWPAAPLYRWYFRSVLPRIGQAVAGNPRGGYNYLPASVGQFPQGEAMRERMRAAGLEDVRSRPFTLGICTLYLGARGS